MLLTALKTVGLVDLLDISLVAMFIYALLFWFERARAAVVAKGMLVLAVVYLISRSMGMIMTTSIFHGFFAVMIVALVIIFQEELRSLFERIAVWSLTRGRIPVASDEAMETLVHTLGDLVHDKVGALVVLRGFDPLDRHLDGGWSLGGELSEPLLKSIFDEHSLGHDGAVVMEGARVTRFGARLPLSRDFGKTSQYGTRHAAALGLAERCDALCIVLSEEKGTIAVARDGHIEPIKDLAELHARIRAFRIEKNPRQAAKSMRTFLRRNSLEKAIAISSSLLLWVLFVLSAKTVQKTLEVPVVLGGVPDGMVVSEVRPVKVSLTVLAQMKDLYRFGDRPTWVHLDLSDAPPGISRVRITDRDVSKPAGYRIEVIDPASVEIDLFPGAPRRRRG
ncbi:MAG: diadenylate cyclase [Elusimicrobiota bacterium]